MAASDIRPIDMQEVIQEMDRARREAKAFLIGQRARAHGVRIICMMCDAEARHKGAEGSRGGRLRNRTCDTCGLRRFRPVWWTERYPTKAEAERKRVRGPNNELLRSLVGMFQ